MIVAMGTKRANVQRTRNAISAWKKTPGSINAAVLAAAAYAKKAGEPRVIIEGNSYMSRVYHIATLSDSVQKYTGVTAAVSVFVVDPNGDVFEGVA